MSIELSPHAAKAGPCIFRNTFVLAAHRVQSDALQAIIKELGQVAVGPSYHSPLCPPVAVGLGYIREEILRCCVHPLGLCALWYLEGCKEFSLQVSVMFEPQRSGDCVFRLLAKLTCPSAHHAGRRSEALRSAELVLDPMSIHVSADGSVPELAVCLGG